jgi:hypothetical protein
VGAASTDVPDRKGETEMPCDYSEIVRSKQGVNQFMSSVRRAVTEGVMVIKVKAIELW